MTPRRIVIAAVVVGVFVVGVPSRQTLTVELRRSGLTQAGIPVKIIHDGEFGSCTPGGPTGRTDRAGRFSMSRWHWYSAISLVLVVVQRDTLCVDDGAGWRPIWSVPYGPASSTHRWDCDLAATPLVNRNKVVFGVCDFATRP